jgi:hypothetical protein
MQRSAEAARLRCSCSSVGIDAEALSEDPTRRGRRAVIGFQLANLAT